MPSASASRCWGMASMEPSVPAGRKLVRGSPVGLMTTTRPGIISRIPRSPDGRKASSPELRNSPGPSPSPPMVRSSSPSGLSTCTTLRLESST